MARIDTAVVIEAEGDAVWLKIGGHCRASLAADQQEVLLRWLMEFRCAADNNEPPPSTSTTLKATRIYS